MKLINLADLRVKLGDRSRSSIIRDYQNDRLPKPKKIGRNLYWVESEIDALIEKLATA